MTENKRKVRVWIERVNNPVCYFHSKKVAFFRILSEEKETIFLCKECERDLENGTLNIGKGIEIEWKRKFSIEDEFSEGIKSNWMQEIRHQMKLGDFGKKYKLPYAHLTEEKRQEFREQVFVSGKPEKTMIIQGKYFLFSFNPEFTFVFGKERDKDGNYVLHIIIVRKNGDNIFPENMRFPEDYWTW